MAGEALVVVLLIFLGLAFLAWQRYVRVAQASRRRHVDTCPYSLTDAFGDGSLAGVRHQRGARWLDEIFTRSARRYPHHTALQIPHTGESLTFAELDAAAEAVAAALTPLVTGPDQIVAVAMEQDNSQIVAAHLGILKAGGAALFLDSTLPDALLTHMLEDARPVAVLTRGQRSFRDLPALDVLALPMASGRRAPPSWLDDPAQRLATIFYTSGTTGRPKGVECTHAGYVNLALSYADYFDLVPGMDATSLTSSLGYDGSISEMYSAWVAGCAVVLLTKEQIRSGPALVPVLREAEVTVLFCPPILLSTLTPDPHLDLPYPICRYVVPAGEAFPPALVEPWTRARRQIVNTYGPTEASTDTSRQSLRPGEPVTIGPPFPNVTYVILDVDGLSPLPHGEVGELCIGGVHVARGYRNLPDETAQKFIEHPRFGRLYRTGDKCRIDAREQQVHFLGRIDTQLKVRGHRVETQPVEDALQRQFGEIEAAVLDYQNEELVAFVAAPTVSGGEFSALAPAPAEWAARLKASLARQFPAPSVPSRLFLVERFVMKPVSGKIDREHLPDLSNLLRERKPRSQKTSLGLPAAAWAGEPARSRSPDTGPRLEPRAAEVLAICSDVLGAPLGWDDAFADHGGHSIVIARLAQRLEEAGCVISVRALLTDCDTARKVAERSLLPPRAPAAAATTAEPERSAPERDEAAAKTLSVSHFTTLQALFLLLLYSPPLLGFLALLAFAEIGAFFVSAALWEFVVVGFLMYLVGMVLPFGSLLWVLAIKLFMGGHLYRNRVLPGVYPKWSRMHLRVWCIERLERSVLGPLSTMFVSGPLMAYVLRRLGARVGRNLRCAPNVAFSGPLDLLAIEDDVAIQTGAYVHMSRWMDETLHVGPVRLESGCKIGMRAGVAGGVTVGRGSWITPLTPVLDDVGRGEIWDGAPAQRTGHCTTLARTAGRCRYTSPAWLMETLNILMQVVLDFWLLVAPTAAITWVAATSMRVGEKERAGEYFQVTPLQEIVWNLGLCAFVSTWGTTVLISVLGCIFLRFTSAPPGLYPSRGLAGALLLYRVKKLNQIQNLWTWTIAGQYLRALAGMRFTRVGASECDVMLNLVPELATAEAQVFWAHGCFTNMLDHGAEHLTLRRLDMPANFFASNNCVVESGQLPSNLLVGVSTPASEAQLRRQMRTRPGRPITVAGNPPIRFGSADFEEENAARELPSLRLFLARVSLFDVLGIGLLPIAEVLVYAVLYTALLRLEWHPLAGALLALILAELVIVACCVAIKKILVGRDWGSAHSTPFWSWRHFTYFFAQDCFFAWCRRPLGILAGTVPANLILRWMGCRIGKRTIVMDPLQASDWNAVSLGDDCVVAGFLQFHTLENMTLKVKRTEVGSRSAVNFGATVMGGSTIEPDTTLLPLSMVLKEMVLPTATYEGSPTEPVSEARRWNARRREGAARGAQPRTTAVEADEARTLDA